MNQGYYEPSGYDELWNYFGLSYASWLTLPRSMMHEMPDEWQFKMAELLHEWDQTWSIDHLGTPQVSLRNGNKFIKIPEWLTNYRHPNRDVINSLKVVKFVKHKSSIGADWITVWLGDYELGVIFLDDVTFKRKGRSLTTFETNQVADVMTLVHQNPMRYACV